ncbi:ABC transporter ATP-binding protein [Rhodovulum sp. YNF3179]|uniref:ABC transporter ATP-binding protein n=1 Tax=Rhodovulum sp. YNF3179 TaxID=3425127 RepID=UPI003D34BB9D
MKDVRFRWPGRDSFSLWVPSFRMEQGESLLLLGESGSGKSTLLSLICGTILADAGSITVTGTDLSDLSTAERDRFRGECFGVIFQQFNLLPFATVGDNILLPLRFAPKRRTYAGDPREAAEKLCGALRLPASLLSAKAATLSVGQQQRVAVARALIGQPPVVIADEPTSALDAGSQAAFLDLLFDQTATNGTSLLMVSHDPRLGDRFDRVVRMEEFVEVESPAS